MLHNNLFAFTAPVTAGDVIKADIKLNVQHQIFAGHFPGNPILPGVCMMQMVKEVLEASINKKTKLIEGQDLKFLSVVSPSDGTMIQAEIKMSAEDEKIKVTAQLQDNAVVFFKFKGIFIQLD